MAASWIGLVDQLQGLEHQFSLVLMEAAMKLAYFTGNDTHTLDATIS